MILQSKLSKTAYPTADPNVWVSGDKENMDPVFLGRLAYFGKVNNVVVVVTENGGYRSYTEQEKMYALYKAGKLQATAAKPGTSRHGFCIAVDSSTQPYRKMTSKELKKYGINKPIKAEGWHGEPIETAGKTFTIIKQLAPVDLAPQLKAKFGLTDAEVNYIAAYKYPADLAAGLLAGKKDFAADTLKYLYSHRGWETLRSKLGL